MRSVLQFASLAWAGLTQYLSDHIESVQKRAPKLIFPPLSYEDALKKSGFILLRQRRGDACITFLKQMQIIIITIIIIKIIIIIIIIIHL